MDNCLAPAWAQSLPDLLAAHRINGIWAGNWGVAARASWHVPWDRTAIRAYCTVHPQALYTAANAHDLARAGVIQRALMLTLVAARFLYRSASL